MARKRPQPGKRYSDRSFLEQLTPDQLVAFIPPAVWRRFAVVYRLNHRELETAKEICLNRSLKNIARDQKIPKGTSRHYIDSLRDKVGSVGKMGLAIRVFGFVLADALDYPDPSAEVEGQKD